MPVLRPEAFRDIDRYLAVPNQGTGAIGVEQGAQSNGSAEGTCAGPPASNILEYQSHPYYPFLLLTMCAIGATYAKQDWKSMAIYMNELARRAGKHLVRRHVCSDQFTLIYTGLQIQCSATEILEPSFQSSTCKLDCCRQSRV
jgi:hypothetical protein